MHGSRCDPTWCESPRRTSFRVRQLNCRINGLDLHPLPGADPLDGEDVDPVHARLLNVEVISLHVFSMPTLFCTTR